ncbi:MAG: AbrB family transcriptional regulator [Cyanobacteria bacterium J06639_1]
MPKKTQPKPLVGKDLMEKARELGDVDVKEKAKACGYVTQTKNGQERINLMQFYNAMLKATDVNLDASDSSGSRGRAPTYRVSVHKNGNLLIGATYTQEMGLSPGDEFEIKLGHRNIKLERLDED